MFARGTGILDVIKERQAHLESIEADYRDRFEDVVRRMESDRRSSPRFSSDVGVHAHLYRDRDRSQSSLNNCSLLLHYILWNPQFVCIFSWWPNQQARDCQGAF